MNELQPAAQPSTLSIQDIFYVFFRHKWKISICTVLGLGAAIAIYFLKPPPYQSEAMLFIRYITDYSAPGMPGNDAKAISPDQRGDTIVNTEVEILSSMDIADQVVDTVGIDKILGKQKGPRDRDRAAVQIRNNLTIEPLPKTSVISVIYRNSDPTIVQPVLTALVDAYEKKHVEVHRGEGAVGDYLSQETDQLRSQLAQTEDELRKAKDKAGIISLDDSKKAYEEQVSRIRQEIFSAEAELAERSAVLETITKQAPAAPNTAAKPASTDLAVPSAAIDAYRGTLSRLELLHGSEQQLLSQFTEQNQRVKDVRSQIAEVETQKLAALTKYPGLAQLVKPLSQASSPAAPAESPDSANSIDLEAEAARLSGLQSKIKVLNLELDQIKKEAGIVDQMEGSITELQRQKDLEETNYKYYSFHLEANRIDEALGSGRALNIAEVQTPTAPHPDVLKEYKILGGVAAGGLIFGIAWAFLIEFYLDHSLRRPKDLERTLRIPLFLSIPDFGNNGHNRYVFHETLRDRLIGYFESRNLTHKPKLLAITGVGRNSGVTTTAAGLAQCLSETGDGNVLLVDMTQGQGAAHQYFKGKPTVGFDQLLKTREDAMVQEKLYVVSDELNSDRLSKALPARFSQLVPKLKASDFDYIIFDMPPVSQISITPRLAGFMDMVLLVVESEKTDRDIAKQAAELLAASNAPVGAVFNKTRNYLPSRIHHEFLGSI